MRTLSASFCLVLILVSFCAPPALPANPGQAYLDPAVASAKAPTIEVIVSATNADRAAEAVIAVGGRVTSELWLIDGVAAEIPAAAAARLSALPAVRSVVADYTVRSADWDGWVTDLPLSERWDGRPDVQPTADPTVWQIVNPVAIDVGADKLHRTAVAKDTYLRGRGVTVAVVDSGVYFDREIRRLLSDSVQRQFLGQADFVEPTCRRASVGQRERPVGQRRSDHCWLGHAESIDDYGHGTAVASIIWNNFTDATTGVSLGVAPEARILSVRVLDNQGIGSYETVIRGIQFVVQQRAHFRVRVLNLSLSATSAVPYFVDPLNRAVERAWLRGLVVVTAAGNDGGRPGSVATPGNDPYVITVGALDSRRTPGYWTDDTLPEWSAAGPTADGFVKPDLLAPGVNIVTFMHSDPLDPARSQRIVQMHPDASATTSLFRMSGTSMATAVASGVAALMLQASPDLEPDQVKYRLLASARAAAVGEPPELVYSVFRQGMGRVWAPDAVLGTFDPGGNGNPAMDLRNDLRQGYATEAELAAHYQGPVRIALSDDGSAYLYYIEGEDGTVLGLGAFAADGSGWLDRDTIGSGRLTWSVGRLAWSMSRLVWVGDQVLPEGRLAWSMGRLTWSVTRLAWSEGRLTWSVNADVDASGRLTWSVGRLAWSVGRMPWDGGVTWESAATALGSGRLAWSMSTASSETIVTAGRWVEAP